MQQSHRRRVIERETRQVEVQARRATTVRLPSSLITSSILRQSIYLPYLGTLRIHESYLERERMRPAPPTSVWPACRKPRELS